MKMWGFLVFFLNIFRAMACEIDHVSSSNLFTPWLHGDRQEGCCGCPLLVERNLYLSSFSIIITAAAIKRSTALKYDWQGTISENTTHENVGSSISIFFPQL